MNIEPLFKKFDELADSPDRIPALRKVILAYLLHLAVNSPDAIACAEKIRNSHETRRLELIKSASRKVVPAVPDVVDEDLPPSLSDIPAVLFDRLGNIASIEKGLSQIQSTKPGKYPLVVTAETRSSSETFDFEGAAAIVPLVSSTGHGDASLKRLHYQEGRYAVGNILAVLKPICPDLIRARFLYEYLTAFKEELLVARMVGTANVSLTINKLKEVPVPLVSGPVLTRIDELMALCDRLESQQQEREEKHKALSRASLARFADAPTPANLQFIFHPSYTIAPADLRKSILTLAVQGKLVPQDPEDEPAEILLRKIGDEKETLLAEKLLKKSQTPENSIDSTDGFSLPTTWRWAKSDDLFFTTKLAGFEYTDHMRLTDYGEVPVIRAQNVKPEGILKTHLKFIDGRTSEALPRSALTKPALLVTFIGAGIGDVAIFDEPDRWHLAPNVAKMEPFNVRGKNLSIQYLLLFMQSPFGRSEIFKHLKSTAQPSISMATIRDIDVPVPPLAEQLRIVAKVEELMKLVDALETQLAASRATAANLLAAIVAELTGTPNTGKVSVPTNTTTGTGTGRRGRPPKS